MRSRLGRLFPLRISAQIAVLVIASLLAIHAVLTVSFFLADRYDRREREDLPAQLAAVVRLAEVDPARRADLVADAAAAFPRLKPVLHPPGTATPAVTPVAGAPPPPADHDLARVLPPGTAVSVVAPAGPDRPDRVAVRLRDGAVLEADVAPRPRPLLGGPLIVSILILASLTTVLGWWAALALTRPLRAFATAAEAFRPDGEIMLLPERGPHEIRIAARALNQMRARVKAMVEERSRMLAAVGHDLRTPITRLRLRSEFIDDDTLRVQALADLDQMRAMVESLLVFMREGQSARAAVRVDLTASLTTVCDQFADLGHDVSYAGPEHAVVMGHPDELQRAVTNLVDNAVRYAGGARVRLGVEADRVVIDVADDGPGIPDSDKAAMLRPFARGESARSMDGTTGFGLGLSIAQVVAGAHGGTLELLDVVPHGLLARIVLPGTAVVPVRPAGGPDGEALDGDAADGELQDVEVRAGEAADRPGEAATATAGEQAETRT
ncbi:ATP-binding protein [Rhodoplanes sp. TEM]|uniref:histidine kinase n=1 Tax=Rhodoplanes tepidamans TaxID=200616 RepID=A0ABT5JCA4_RHOTP|nr:MULTISPECIES: ATP-binding protein [Rhodoplanes]MDC7786904.1 ATP-binding protein [Rhodoplanes tepidamans]MDC7985370.1 ATP-binding protein [Rhodoplanes sp. TEM]MDQ0355400.1 signal transduction histidine kinase [Rhodoplanes tepidamans]